MTTKLFHLIWLYCMCYIVNLQAQTNVININIQPFNVTPEATLNASIVNNGEEQQGSLITQIVNSANSPLITVKSQSFLIRKGLNTGMIGGERKISSVQYGNNSQANYLKTSHNLPSGKYKVCVTLLLSAGEPDNYCDELEAEFNQYLYLINPLDKDTVDSKNPILSWTHSEPFSILNQGEFYRMVVSEIKKDQSAEDAIIVNSPIMIKNYLKEHQLQYPFDAKELVEGGKYAWQVQKLSDGVIVNKTESWEFNLRKLPETISLKYVALKRQLDGAFYTAHNGKVYFKFSEEYSTKGSLKFKLTDAKLNPIDIEIVHDKEAVKASKPASNEPTKLKQLGDNRFDLDLNDKASGFYTLEVKNEKKESFYLKIFLP